MRPGNGFRPVPVKPINNGNHHRRESTEARSHRNESKRQIEFEKGIHPRKPHKAQAEHASADAQYEFGTVAIDQPTLNRAQNAAFDSGQRERRSNQGLTPPKFFLQ